MHADLVPEVDERRCPRDSYCVVGFEFVNNVLQDGMHPRPDRVATARKVREHPSAETTKEVTVLVRRVPTCRLGEVEVYGLGAKLISAQDELNRGLLVGHSNEAPLAVERDCPVVTVAESRDRFAKRRIDHQPVSCPHGAHNARSGVIFRVLLGVIGWRVGIHGRRASFGRVRVVRRRCIAAIGCARPVR